MADDLQQFVHDADANMRFYCDSLLRLAANDPHIRALRIGPSSSGVSDPVTTPPQVANTTPTTFEVAYLLNDGHWYALIAPELHFRQAVLHYLFTENQISLEGPIHGQIEVRTNTGLVVWQVTGASSDDAILLTRAAG